MRTNELLSKKKEELEKLILNNAPYEKIFKKSQELDFYITMEFKHINKYKDTKNRRS